MSINIKNIVFVAVCCTALLLVDIYEGMSKDSKLGFDVSSQISQPIKAPNRFGLDGDDTWLEAGQKRVPFAQRKRIVEVFTAGVLDQPDTEYRLMKDVVADGTAFQIVKNNITLNLNGHTVIYARNPTTSERYGVHLTKQWQFSDIVVVNGAILQAEAKIGILAGSFAAGLLGFVILRSVKSQLSERKA